MKTSSLLEMQHFLGYSNQNTGDSNCNLSSEVMSTFVFPLVVVANFNCHRYMYMTSQRV